MQTIPEELLPAIAEASAAGATEAADYTAAATAALELSSQMSERRAGAVAILNAFSISNGEVALLGFIVQAMGDLESDSWLTSQPARGMFSGKSDAIEWAREVSTNTGYPVLDLTSDGDPPQ